MAEEREKSKGFLLMNKRNFIFSFSLWRVLPAMKAIFATICDLSRDEGEREKEENASAREKEREKREEEQIRARTEGQRRKFSSSVTFSSQSSLTQQLSLGFG